MNHSTLRKLAASTAIICQENGGTVTVFFLLKALYLADRQMLIDYGAPITGDKYSSMPKGPVLQGAYNLLKGGKALGDAKTQAEWDAAFVRNENDVSVVHGVTVDTDCLSPVEEKILREKIRLVMELDRKKVNVADWMHKNCPEWEKVPENSSKPIPMQSMLEHARHIDSESARAIVETVKDGLAIRQSSLLSKESILVA